MTTFTPRPSQARILAYTGGKLGVSAVPGSGKTGTLSQLAAKLVRETPLARGQQILIVTLVNAACGKFEQQVREALGVLEGATEPNSLIQKSISLAGIALEMAGKAAYGQGAEVANDLLRSGKALEKMQQIIQIQRILAQICTHLNIFFHI